MNKIAQNEKKQPPVFLAWFLYLFTTCAARQLITFEFVENRKNVNVFGVASAGKSYFINAFCMEACRRELRCKFIDYAEFMDGMQNLYRDNYTSYKRKLKYYSKVQLLMIDVLQSTNIQEMPSTFFTI